MSDETISFIAVLVFLAVVFACFVGFFVFDSKQKLKMTEIMLEVAKLQVKLNEKEKK